MTKADKKTAVTELTKLFRKVWEEEKIPDKWKKGVIVKLPKKRDIRECSINWRGVTLLTVPSKLFGRIIINRLDSDMGEVPPSRFLSPETYWSKRSAPQSVCTFRRF